MRETIAAFNHYVQLSEQRMRNDLQSGVFLWMEGLPIHQREDISGRVKRGEVVIEAGNAGTWSVHINGAPSARSHHVAVWTGSEMFVWGGKSYSTGALDTGGIYDPTRKPPDSYVYGVRMGGAPEPRYDATAGSGTTLRTSSLCGGGA